MSDEHGRDGGLPAVAAAVTESATAGRRTVAARVTDIKGFSTWPGDDVIAFDDAGAQHGRLVGSRSVDAVREAAAALLAQPAPGLATVVVEIHGAEVAEAGLSCGGRAELLLQPTAAVPAELWSSLAARAPVALLTRISGSGQSADSMVVLPGGQTWGSIPGPSQEAVATAGRLLAGGHTATRRVDDADGTVLVEAWIPTPRMVVVGTGDLVAALSAQARLLGWDTTAVEDRPAPDGPAGTGTRAADAAGGPDADGPGAPIPGLASWPSLRAALSWAGVSAAVVVLSHDPHVDAPALGICLDAGVAYVGAMGSRGTQARRLEALLAAGRQPAELDRIHRPIGLDLGGRGAAEISLSICAEILACHCGRDARPLAEHDGPINDRPTAVATN